MQKYAVGNKDGPERKTITIAAGYDDELVLLVSRMGTDEVWNPQWDDSKIEGDRTNMYILIIDMPDDPTVDPEEHVASVIAKLKVAEANKRANATGEETWR
jgi:hypothetical protein